MTLDQFELRLKEIDQRLRVVPHPSNDDVAGIYCEDMFITTIPSREIHDETIPQYKDKYGRVHRNAIDATAIAVHFLERIKDPEYLKFARGEEE